MIRDVRIALIEMGHFGLADVLEEAVDLMHRRRPVRRMRAKSPTVTPEIRQQIITLAINTELHVAEIAAQVGVNPGRVSEVLQRYARINRAR
jgi:hypothetical protein